MTCPAAVSLAAMAPTRAQGLSAGWACVHPTPSHVHVSLRKVPRLLLPPDITTFPMDGSLAIAAPPRPGGPPGAAAWPAHVLPSNVHVSPTTVHCITPVHTFTPNTT